MLDVLFDINALLLLQLLIKAIDRAAQHLYQDSLVSRLAAVHVVFHTVRKEILWFGQLVTVNPKILKPMMSVLSSEEMREMVGLLIHMPCVDVFVIVFFSLRFYT